MPLAAPVKRDERRDGLFQVPLLQPESRYPGQTFIADVGVFVDGVATHHFHAVAFFFSLRRGVSAVCVSK